MADNRTLGETLAARGISRRTFLKFCVTMTSMLALPPAMATVMAEKLVRVRRQSVIWLSFQECTGCTESITRSHAPTLEGLIFDAISLDYHHTLQAASGEAASQFSDGTSHGRGRPVAVPHVGQEILVRHVPVAGGSQAAE